MGRRFFFRRPPGRVEIEPLPHLFLAAALASGSAAASLRSAAWKSRPMPSCINGPGTLSMKSARVSPALRPVSEVR